eukprot:CAMPEP_0117756408 /NCGR_PEP_ID=MMETSP0947-20121206/14063_1 /TAXON_ID=44440 /ORGANISM="Chattonella subsalsa, Strain CCMP2191" /LENGTH=226 /DNA_ID=CAMNT_0005575995 /DNA_START=73 /DNA_END=750 /DNA_ORIENTATION=+
MKRSLRAIGVSILFPLALTFHIPKPELDGFRTCNFNRRRNDGIVIQNMAVAEVAEKALRGPKKEAQSKKDQLTPREVQINKELSVKQRKLRQIFDLEDQYTTDPDSLNDDQVNKLERKDELLSLISSLEAERREIAASKRKEKLEMKEKKTKPTELAAPPMPKKLAAFLVWTRVCSSDLAHTLIALNKVRVNGEEVQDPGFRINGELDEITVSGEIVKPRREMDLW